MLTRRGFAGCAICALTGVIATDASAQAAAPVACGIFHFKLNHAMSPFGTSRTTQPHPNLSPIGATDGEIDRQLVDS
jgi:hypothetical protein